MGTAYFRLTIARIVDSSVKHLVEALDELHTELKRGSLKIYNRALIEAQATCRRLGLEDWRCNTVMEANPVAAERCLWLVDENTGSVYGP